MRSLRVAVLCLFIAAFVSATAPGTKLTVQVNTSSTGRPIDRASVIIHFKQGRNPINMRKIRTSWETRTNQEGIVSIPEIPQGKITIQVIAQNYQTFGGEFDLDQPEQTISIKLNSPQAQYSEDSKSK
jgi:hypothetical protein